MSFQAYLINIEEKTGVSPQKFETLAAERGFAENGKLKIGIKATDIVNWLKTEYDLGHGHAMAMYAYITGKRS